MKKVYSSQSILMVGHMRNMLKGQGIGCWIRNEVLSSGAGELPPTDCWPELWIREDGDYAAAMALVASVLRWESEPRPGWRCPGCGEEQEAQFTQCWKCGAGGPE